MIRSVLRAAVAALALSAAAPALAQPVTGKGEWNGSASFDQQVLNYIAKHGLPGATVAVTRGGRLVLSKGYGYARLSTKTPMQPTHLTYIGSTSKLVTAVGALKLVDDGKLSLNDRLYGSSSVVWGSDPMAPPLGYGTPSGGVLQNPGDYFEAMIEGVNALDPNFPPSAGTSPTLLASTIYRAAMNRTFDWASKVRIKHLLSHTAGYLRSGTGATEAAEKEFGVATYKGAHIMILRGLNGAPFELEPETQRDYSNHGFGLVGLVIEERGGKGYEQFIRDRVLTPLGLHDFVRGGTGVTQSALPYVLEKHSLIEGATAPKEVPYTVSTLGLASGGWVGTAEHLVRFMCGLDRKTVNPILSTASRTAMETIAYPAVDPNQPLGWDARSGGELRKNGAAPAGGTSQVIKFLPGEIGEDEINIAIATNIYHSPDDIVAFLRSLAKIVASQSIPQDYDLFDAKYPCVIDAVSGTVQLRDNSPTAPACPRPAEVAASILTSNAGPVPYVLACTGGREWKGTMTAHKTDATTSLGIAVHPFEITKPEEITCVLRRGEQFGLSDVLATHKRFYPCKVTGVAIPPAPPFPPAPPAVLIPPKPQEPQPPQLTCLGGKVVTRAAAKGRQGQASCECPRGQTVQAIAGGSYKNTFQCIPVAAVPPRIACAGGSVRNDACVCQPGYAPVKTGATAFRCERVAVLPPPKSIAPVRVTPQQQIACAGGVVRSNVCVCPGGTALQGGACRAVPRAPVRVTTPSRSNPGPQRTR